MLDWTLENIVLIHYLLFGLGFVLAVIPTFKRGLGPYFWDVVGLLAVAFALVCIVVVSGLPPDENEISETIKLFLIMSVTTVGLGPLASTVSFLLSGRLVGRYVRRIGSWVFGRVRMRGGDAELLD